MSYANGVRGMTYVPSNNQHGITRTVDLTAGDVVRAQFDAGANLDTGSQNTQFSITRVK